MYMYMYMYTFCYMYICMYLKSHWVCVYIHVCVLESPVTGLRYMYDFIIE